MTKITISQVKETLSTTATGKGLIKYLSLRDRIHQVNVSKDEQFQKDYNHFFRIRQKSEVFYAEYYKFMEKHKGDNELTFETVLNHLHKKIESVEASFASKLLSMINPDMPVLDSRVLENLGIKRVRHSDSNEWIKRNVAAYQAICEWYENHFKSGEATKWIKLFDEHYPEAKGKITGVKKIDLILWQIGG
jgi:hypothetical protein